MSILSAVTMALLLSAEPTDPPAAPPAAVEPAAPTPAPAAALQAPDQPVGLDQALTAAASVTAPSATSRATGTPLQREVRAGIGLSVASADKGFASTFQAGVQVDPWDRLGFRVGGGMTTSVFGAGGWDAAEFSGSVMYRPLGDGRRVVPYVGLGAQLAMLAVFPDDAPATSQGLVKMGQGQGHGAPMLASSSDGGIPTRKDPLDGTSYFQAMPEATVGAMFRLTPRLALDVAGRYLPLRWKGTTYNGASVVASIATPF